MDLEGPGEERTPPGVALVRAGNPSPLTLEGTNTWIVGGWVVDPGPADHPGHVEAVVAAAGRADAGRIDGIVLTHGHGDHAGAAQALAGAAGGVPIVRPRDDEEVGPLRAVATPGHTPDHVALVHGETCFTGDAVLGRGSVFVAPGEGSLAAYLDSLRRLRGLDLAVLCPGHGPVVWDPAAKLDEYLEHRLDRERRLLAGLEAGARATGDLLDAAWDEVPDHLRGAAAVTLEAHLEKLEGEGRLPAGVERLDLGPGGVREPGT